jgi:hypothetical protein
VPTSYQPLRDFIKYTTLSTLAGCVPIAASALAELIEKPIDRQSLPGQEMREAGAWYSFQSGRSYEPSKGKGGGGLGGELGEGGATTGSSYPQCMYCETTES